MIKVTLYVKFRVAFFDLGTIDRNWLLSIPGVPESLIEDRELLRFNGIRGVRLIVETLKG